MVDGINRTKMHTYNTATGQLVSTALGTPGTSNCPLYNQSCHPNWYFYEFAQEFDQSGNVKASYEVDTDVNSQEAVPTETRHYYDAAERLTYSNTMRGFIWWAGTGFGTFTDYRYDALGRRVLSRTRRVESTCAVPCDAFIERTVYDGDQVLAEIRSSGQIGASASVLKADGVAAQNGQTSGWTDPRYPHLFGIVLYAHGLGIDAPVHVLKRHPNGSWAGFTPLEDWRGSYWGGRRTNGSACDSTCPAEWPSGAVNAFGRELGIEPATYTTWHGSLIRGRKDANGLTYLRNRYYDPTTGQFTQPDPIGLAGGLNLYGYADGDPINKSDPFGLCPGRPGCPKGNFSGATAMAVLQSLSTLRDNLTPRVSLDVMAGPVTASFSADATAVNISPTVGLAVTGTLTFGQGAGDLGTGSVGALGGAGLVLGGAVHGDTDGVKGVSLTAGAGVVLAPTKGASLLFRALSHLGLGAGQDENGPKRRDE